MKSEKELRQLGAWIAENIFKLENMTRYYIGDDVVYFIEDIAFQPHEDSRQAMEVLKKCLALGEAISISMTGTAFTVANDYFAFNADTLELAICLLAQKLFTPNPES